MGSITLWQWSTKDKKPVFKMMSDHDDFCVLVDLTDDTKDMEYFIVPTIILDNWITKDFQEWIDTPGRNGRPHSKRNPKRSLYCSKSKDRLEPYHNNWNVLWQ